MLGTQHLESVDVLAHGGDYRSKSYTCLQHLFIHDKYLALLNLGFAPELWTAYDEVVARTLGENLKRLRLDRGLTQEGLAALLEHAGGKNSTVSKWERDTDWLPSRRTIARLCAILKCEPWELFEDAVTPYDRFRVRPREGGLDFERRVGMPDRRVVSATE